MEDDKKERTLKAEGLVCKERGTFVFKEPIYGLRVTFNRRNSLCLRQDTIEDLGVILEGFIEDQNQLEEISFDQFDY